MYKVMGGIFKAFPNVQRQCTRKQMYIHVHGHGEHIHDYGRYKNLGMGRDP